MVVTTSGDDMTPPRGDGAAGHESDHSGRVTVGVDGDDDGSRGSEQLVGAEREDGVCGGEEEGSGDDRDDVDEIVELRRALEYLVSDADDDGRRRGSIDQVSSRRPNGVAAKVVEPDREKTRHEQQRYMIPNLVNRVLMEHYSTNHRRETSQDPDAHARNMTIQQTETLTTLLLAVIVEYAEPHFVRVALHRERERKKLLLSQQQKKTRQDRKKMPRSTAENAHCRAEEYSDFDDRAVSWATTCIHQLIKPPASSSPKIGNESDDCYRSGDGYNIPALDALLAASGPHDGMALEKRMQSALVDGLQGRRLLQIIGLSTQNRDS